MTTVDQLLNDNGNPCIRAVKVDLEGFDVEALQGASSLLTGNSSSQHLDNKSGNLTRHVKLNEWRRMLPCRPCIVMVEMLSSMQRKKGLYDHTYLTVLMERFGYTLVHFNAWSGFGENDGDYFFGLISDDVCHATLSRGLRRFMKPGAVQMVASHGE